MLSTLPTDDGEVPSFYYITPYDPFVKHDTMALNTFERFIK